MSQSQGWGVTARDRCLRRRGEGNRARECAKRVRCAPCWEAGRLNTGSESLLAECRPSRLRPFVGEPKLVGWGETLGEPRWGTSACQPRTNGSAGSSQFQFQSVNLNRCRGAQNLLLNLIGTWCVEVPMVRSLTSFRREERVFAPVLGLYPRSAWPRSSFRAQHWVRDTGNCPAGKILS